jgi:HPt (histidine-containing phosphotransfer) domain-containing protein
VTEPNGALDRRVLEELSASVGGDQEFLAELVEDFLADAPAQLEALRTAAASDDAGTARRAAHTLKGTSRTFGAVELGSMCQEAETAAGAGDVGTVAALLEGIDAEWARVRAELLLYRDNGA